MSQWLPVSSKMMRISEIALGEVTQFVSLSYPTERGDVRGVRKVDTNTKKTKTKKNR